MQTIIRITIVTVLAIMALQVKAQTITVCASNTAAVIAINSSSLISPSYSMNPGGIISPGSSFIVSPASTTSYTLYVTGATPGNTMVTATTSNVVTVQVVAYVPVITTVSPVNQTVSCGPGIAVNATCVAISPSTNVTHYWYSPATPIPISSSGQTSTYLMTPMSGSLTTFTCVVVDNISGCSSSKTVQVISTAGQYPGFAVSGNLTSSTFTLGCGTRSVTDLNIFNAMTSPPGGALSYTLLTPSFTGTNYVTNTMASYTVNVPGTYTIVVKDNVNLCESRVALPVIQNISAPPLFVTALTRTLNCTTPSVALQGSSSTPNVNYYVWKRNTSPPTIINATLVVNSTTAGASVPSATVVDTYTLMGMDYTTYGNHCPASTVVTIYQNTRLPNANIAASSTAGPCTNTINLSNNSTTGALPGTFYATLPVVANLWEGPQPQAPATFTSTYLAYSIGIYTMTAEDQNNGCVQTATIDITDTMLKPTAAFAHTVTNAVAVFNDVSGGTDANTLYYWNFGDGNISTIQNPTHTYISGGSHLVTHKVTNQGILCADSVIQSVTVSGIPCMANSGFSMVPTNTAQVWNVIPDYPWNVTAASWNWGDGSVPSNTLYTSHQYATAGMYNICLTVTVSCVASSSTCTSYSVYHVSQDALVLDVNVIAPELILGLSTVKADGQLSWNIQPNPNAGEFQLNVINAKSGPARIIISDVTGRIVHDQIIEPDSKAVSVQAGNLPSGLYLVTLESGGLKTTKRLIVNR